MCIVWLRLLAPQTIGAFLPWSDIDSAQWRRHTAHTAYTGTWGVLKCHAQEFSSFQFPQRRNSGVRSRNGILASRHFGWKLVAKRPMSPCSVQRCLNGAPFLSVCTLGQAPAGKANSQNQQQQTLGSASSGMSWMLLTMVNIMGARWHAAGIRWRSIYYHTFPPKPQSAKWPWIFWWGINHCDLKLTRWAEVLFEKIHWTVKNMSKPCLVMAHTQIQEVLHCPLSIMVSIHPWILHLNWSLVRAYSVPSCAFKQCSNCSTLIHPPSNPKPWTPGWSHKHLLTRELVHPSCMVSTRFFAVLAAPWDAKRYTNLFCHPCSPSWAELRRHLALLIVSVLKYPDTRGIQKTTHMYLAFEAFVRKCLKCM